MCDEEFIGESVLGTKQYWDHFYDEELNNFVETGDGGETWFGRRNTHNIIQWISVNIPSDGLDFQFVLHSLNFSIFLANICDVGCGNGYVISQLSEKGFTNLLGVDYSEKAIEFCNNLYKSNTSLCFQVLDILQDVSLSEKVDVFVDKGTYDAICLMPNSDIKNNREKYFNFIKTNLKSNGYFVLMSCNFTKEELFKSLFDNSEFQSIHEFDAPKLTFGGQVGQQVTGLVMQKCERKRN